MQQFFLRYFSFFLACFFYCAAFAQNNSVPLKDTVYNTFNEQDVSEPNDSLQQKILNDLLFEAADKGNTDDVLKQLLKGADVNSKTYEGITPLMYAAQNGHLEVAEILIHNGADVNARPADGVTALIAATRFNHEDVIDTLIHYGALMNVKTNDSATALLYASAYGYFIPVDMLVFYGANVNLSAIDGSSPLIIASLFGNKEIVELLLNKGADIYAKDSTGWTALHCAVYNSHIDIVKLLLEKGAAVNQKNKDSYTALAIASETGNSEIAEYLLSHGADVSFKTNDSASAFRLALLNNKIDILKTLKKNGAKKELKPVLNNIRISPIGFDMNNHDFMYSIDAGIHDIKYNIGFDLGYCTRLWANRTLVPIGADTYYQFWETRSLFSLSFEKLFKINTCQDFQQGIFVDAKGVYTYGKYTASKTKPNDLFLFSPCIGYMIFNNSVGAKISYEYLDLKVKDLLPHRINIGFFFTIKIRKYLHAYKEINWL
jgi:ankyrin repeat protein